MQDIGSPKYYPEFTILKWAVSGKSPDYMCGTMYKVLMDYNPLGLCFD